MKIDSDGDVAVAFGNQAWVYNPGLLTPAQGRKVDVLEEKNSDESSDDESRGKYSTSQLKIQLVRYFYFAFTSRNH